ncbi:MAG TPA: hypothetical protein VFZ58_04030 [Candidatus Saccharimonadales bacterium]
MSALECVLVIVLSLIAVIIAVKVVKACRRRGRQRLKEELCISYQEEWLKFLSLDKKIRRQGAQASPHVIESINALLQLHNELEHLLNPKKKEKVSDDQLSAADDTLNKFAVLLDEAEKAFNSSNEATPH